MTADVAPPRRRPPLWAAGLALLMLVGLAAIYAMQGRFEELTPEGAGIPLQLVNGPGTTDAAAEAPPHLSMVAWQQRMGVPIDGFEAPVLGEPAPSPPPGGTTYSGRVVTGDGVELPGAKVSLLQPAAASGLSAVTREDGSFDIPGIPRDETLTVEVAHPALGVASHTGQRSIDSPVVLRLESFRRIEVALTKAGGAPITDFEAALWPGDLAADDLEQLDRLPFKYLHHPRGEFVVTDLTQDIVTVIVRALPHRMQYKTVDLSTGPQRVTFAMETAENGAL